MNDLIEKYLNQQLTTKERQEFTLLLNDQDSVEDIYKELLIKKAFTEDKDNTFRQLMEEITYEYKIEKQFSKDALVENFAPLEDYELNLEGITRASEFQVFQPIFEGNYTHCLPFRLERGIFSPFLLIVENNDYDELICQEIPPYSIAFDIDLPPEKGFQPGRYYWKLTTKRHQVSAMGVFFIGKDLLLNK